MVPARPRTARPPRGAKAASSRRTPWRCAHYHCWRRPHRSGSCAGPPIPRANERTRASQKWHRGTLGRGNLFEGYPAVFVADQRAKRAGESPRVRWKRLRPVNAGCEQGILGRVLRQVNAIRGLYLLRGFCYTPCLPGARGVVSRSWERDWSGLRVRGSRLRALMRCTISVQFRGRAGAVRGRERG